MVTLTSHIDTHIRTYRSLLKSAGEVAIGQLIHSHIAMGSILHERAGKKAIDAPAFIYALLRLPFCIRRVRTIILGQSYTVFQKSGFGHIGQWRTVEAPGRRRKMLYDRKKTLAVYIASVTDVDDLVTLLTAFQIEWNKLHEFLKNAKSVKDTLETLFAPVDLARISAIMGKDYLPLFTAIKKRPIALSVRLLAGSYVEYAKATQRWWDHVDSSVKKLQLQKRSMYFVSSNTHSIANVLTRFVKDEQQALIAFLYKSKSDTLIHLWEQIERGEYPGSRENFLYYLAKKYTAVDASLLKRKAAREKALGIYTVKPFHYLDIAVQVIDLSKLAGVALDERLGISTQHLKTSNALLVNIDYPLGWAAYQVLTEIGQNVEEIRGMYIMGKAATQNGAIGDILIPTTVFDEHTKNVYTLNNAFSASDFSGLFKTGNVLDGQKTVSVKGTFFENRQLLAQWYKQGYTIVEMETGPYLNAAYEFVYYNRYVENQTVNLTAPPFELGIAHYASDTPNSKATNLGVRNLSYEGVEATYSISLAIIKKIIEREKKYATGY